MLVLFDGLTCWMCVCVFGTVTRGFSRFWGVGSVRGCFLVYTCGVLDLWV